MRPIDYLRLEPMFLDALTDKGDFDASDYIKGATAFNISEVADWGEYLLAPLGVEPPSTEPAAQSGFRRQLSYDDSDSCE